MKWQKFALSKKCIEVETEIFSLENSFFFLKASNVASNRDKFPFHLTFLPFWYWKIEMSILWRVLRFGEMDLSQIDFYEDNTKKVNHCRLFECSNKVSDDIVMHGKLFLWFHYMNQQITVIMVTELKWSEVNEYWRVWWIFNSESITKRFKSQIFFFGNWLKWILKKNIDGWINKYSWKLYSKITYLLFLKNKILWR